MGFAAGFAAGWGAVDSAMRQKMDAERQKRDDEFRASELAMRQADHADRQEERGRVKTIRQGLADAAAEPETGVAVGKNFAAGAGDQQFLRDQAQAEADLAGTPAPAEQAAATSGNQVRRFSDAGQAANFAADRQGDLGYTKRAADVYRKAGEEGKARELDAEFKKLSKEGYKEALDTILATGNADEAAKIFNKIGGSRIPEGSRLTATPVMRKGADGVEHPDYDLSIVGQDGAVRQLGSAAQMRYMADGFDKYQSVLAGQRAEGRANTQLGYEGDKVGIARDAQKSSAAVQAAQVTDMGERRTIDRDKLKIEELNVRSMIQDRGAQRAIAAGHLSLARAKYNDEKSGGALLEKVQGVEKAIGRPLTEIEKFGVLGMNKGVKETDLDKAINDSMLQYQKDNPKAKPQEIAAMRETLKRSISAAGPMLEVEARLKAMPPDQRAAATAEASTKFGLDAAWFTERGLPPPAAPGATKPPAASPVASPAAQAAAIPGSTQADPRAQQYSAAVQALRARQQALGQQAASGTPDQQRALAQQITALGTQIQQTVQQAAQVGVRVE